MHDRDRAVRREHLVQPRAVQQILDRAIQVFGGAGLSEDYPLAEMFAGVRSLRLADGPDEVHLNALGKAEFGR